jgi:hypothetical protein
MRCDDFRRSTNIEDSRADSAFGGSMRIGLSTEQHRRWSTAGLKVGIVESCNTLTTVHTERIIVRLIIVSSVLQKFDVAQSALSVSLIEFRPMPDARRRELRRITQPFCSSRLPTHLRAERKEA